MLPHELLNNLRLQESLKTSNNDSLVPSFPAKIKILLILAKNSWKPEKQKKTFPVVRCFTWKLELV